MIAAFVLIQTEIGRVAEVGKALRDAPGVESADEVTGPYDIIAKVHASDLLTLGRSVTGAIQKIPGVTRTLTCPTTRHLNLPEDPSPHRENDL
ncbi:Lrp/AsnC ligand binding domain-containing protein [Acidithrix sp. C25]|uniref:AsnC family protein n=2 Tax=root TaxID=1 RepID=A0A0D8HIP7_9ACTN|nr:Lrp/AsnC ligand binding domain-containing protein [Acidithrix sp. C25]KJF16941.1 AsnC family protein [Acidithrix ferrooxidans]CAG4904152.1 unnamed protein product [Acidithrix sp. C25]